MSSVQAAVAAGVDIFASVAVGMETWLNCRVHKCSVSAALDIHVLVCIDVAAVVHGHMHWCSSRS